MTTSPDDWLSPREAGEILQVGPITVTDSLRDPEMRQKWWEHDGVKGWRLMPLAKSQRWQVRRWAVELVLERQHEAPDPADPAADDATDEPE